MTGFLTSIPCWQSVKTLRWDRMFCCNRYHLLFEAGWENLIFLGQNQLMRFTTQTNSGINIPTQGDLSLQGLSLRALFAF